MGRSSAWTRAISRIGPLTAPWGPALELFRFAGACRHRPPSRSARALGRLGRRARLRGPDRRARRIERDAARPRGGGAARRARPRRPSRSPPSSSRAPSVTRRAAGIDTVFTRPQGLDRLWVRYGFIPVPEADLAQGAPRAARAWASTAGAAAPRCGAQRGAVRRPACAPAPGATASSGCPVKLVALAGGTGAAKLLRGLAPLVDPRDLSVIVNTGDDAEDLGAPRLPRSRHRHLRARRADRRRARAGACADETFHALDHMARFGEPTWFNLGDRDLATHLHRTRLLASGDAA